MQASVFASVALYLHLALILTIPGKAVDGIDTVALLLTPFPDPMNVYSLASKIPLWL